MIVTKKPEVHAYAQCIMKTSLHVSSPTVCAVLVAQSLIALVTNTAQSSKIKTCTVTVSVLSYPDA